MRTLTLTNSLFNNLLTNWDKAFSDEDYSYWRRKGEGVRGVELNDSFEYYEPLAGFKKEDIEATVSEGIVYISAKRGESTAFYSFRAPEEGDVSKLSAKHEDGLLTVTVSKSEAVKPKTIEII